MTRFPYEIALALAAVLLAPVGASAQLGPRDPRIGYVYPAGGLGGTTFQVTVGGQYFGAVSGAILSGPGAKVTLVEHTKPLTPKQVNTLRQQLRQLQERVQALRKKGNQRTGTGDVVKIAQDVGLEVESYQDITELRKRIFQPNRIASPQLAEIVTLQVRLADDVEPGKRELRLVTASGISNPLCFEVGKLPEYRETEPNDTTPDAGIEGPLPVVLNGQIMPGDVDRFAFTARKGERLVVAASARRLIPYLADAVPGWFQATLALYDARGNELAYADDHRFDPDPVFYYEIPGDGRYVLEIKDAIFRGREDFVYRITLGEVPFVTSVFPLGASGDGPATLEVEGWNLPDDRITLDTQAMAPGIHAVSLRREAGVSHDVPFAVDALAECLEKEPNDGPANAQHFDQPAIVNGRIDRPGDWDVFRFEARAGDRLVAEVVARRLGSPLDSLIELTDAEGQSLASNDDHDDPGAGLTTHQADSRVEVTIPADGTYCLRLGDTQRQGGSDHGYRLRISPSRPDFELRVVPSSINARAGTTVPITVYALRRDGFQGDVAIELVDPPAGFQLSGAWVPSGCDKVRLTLTVPPSASEEPLPLSLEGRGVIAGHQVRRPATAAEDMMQAFIYRHLVPAQNLMVAVTERPPWAGAAQSRARSQARGPQRSGGPARAGAALRHFGSEPVVLPAGQSTRVEILPAAGPMMSQIGLELNDPPEGVTLEKASSVRGGLALLVHVDAEKARPGLKGNLIIDAFTERVVNRAPGRPQGTKRRFPVGTLPAVPFEITAPDAP